MLGGVLGTEEKYKIKYQEKSDYNKYKNQYLVRVKNLGYKKKKYIYIYTHQEFRGKRLTEAIKTHEGDSNWPQLLARSKISRGRNKE